MKGDLDSLLFHRQTLSSSKAHVGIVVTIVLLSMFYVYVLGCDSYFMLSVLGKLLVAAAAVAKAQHKSRCVVLVFRRSVFQGFHSQMISKR